jgi:hypothetical protein
VFQVRVHPTSEVPIQDAASDWPRERPNARVARRTVAGQLLTAGTAALLVAGCEVTTGGTTRPERDSDQQNDSMDRNGNGGSYQVAKAGAYPHETAGRP